MMWLEKVIRVFKRRPKCPVNSSDKLLLDKAFYNLIEEFGEKSILTKRVYIDPEEIMGSDLVNGEVDVQKLFLKLGYILDVDLEFVELNLFSEPEDLILDSGVSLESENESDFSSSKFTEYSDGSFDILINSRYMKDPTCLISSIAFELIRLKFRREELEFSGDDLSIEAALVIFGFGVFNANSSIVKMETWSGDLRSGWNFKKGPSQIPPEAHGYLLALFSFYSGQNNPKWTNSLEKEVLKFFYASINYLLDNAS